MILPCCLILNLSQLPNGDRPKTDTGFHFHTQCILCMYKLKFLHNAKMRLFANCLVLAGILVILIINCASALFWSPSNICEQNPRPACEPGEYLQSQFIASTNESEVMNCSPYSTFERKLWFDCVVSFFIR